MSTIAPAIAERAVEWMVELQSHPVSPETYAQWQHWRGDDPEHERAWLRVEAFGERFSGLAQNARVAQATLATAQDAQGLDRRQALKALAVLVSLGAGAWAGRSTAPWQNLTADYHSAVGEQRRLTLADGTQVLLNTDSAIDVRFDATARRLRLLRGEVQVQTGADARPFWAHTDHGRVESHASRFLLRQWASFSRVVVKDGRVSLHSGQPAPLLLDAGQQVVFSGDQVGPVRRSTDAEQAWIDGILIADNQRLEDFLAEVSRYRTGHLSCSKTLADLRVAGTYPLANTDRILQTLATTLNVRVRRFTPYWVTVDAIERRA